MVTRVQYYIQGDEDETETGIESSFIVPDDRAGELTLKDLKELFPYYGRFHYRLKVADSSGKTSHVWLDLTRDSDDLVSIARNLGGVRGLPEGGETIDIKVLPLSLDGQTEEVSQDAFAWDEWTVGRAMEGFTIDQRETSSNQINSKVNSSKYDHNTREKDTSHTAEKSIGVPSPRPPTPSQSTHEKRRESALAPEDWSTAGGGGGSVWEEADSMPQQSRNDSISAPNTPGGTSANNTWAETIGSGLSSAMGSRTAQDIKKTSAHVAKSGLANAKKLFGRIQAGGAGARSKPPSQAALNSLSTLTHLLETPFYDGVSSHLELLRQLWDGAFPGVQFSGPTSNRWKEIGFQSDRVDGDLDRTGILCLKCLVHLTNARQHSSRARTIIEAQNPPSNRTFPVAVVGRNITGQFSDFLGLTGHRYETTKAPYWQLFETDEAFLEVFCWAFFRVDAIWREEQATRDTFSSVIGRVSNEFSTILSAAPDSIQAFHHIASEHSSR